MTSNQRLMKNPVCVSTGCFYPLGLDANQSVEKLRQLDPDIDGVELLWASSHFLLKERLEPANMEYLKKLERNSMHAPWKGVSYGDNEQSLKVLDRIDKIYKQAGAENVVFHPDTVEDYDIILRRDFQASVENMDSRKKAGSDISGLEELLDATPALGFVLDIAHCLTFSEQYLHDMMRHLGGRAVALHVSAPKNGVSHALASDSRALTYIENVPEGVPLVLEGHFNKLPADLLRETGYVRAL